MRNLLLHLSTMDAYDAALYVFRLGLNMRSAQYLANKYARPVTGPAWEPSGKAWFNQKHN